MNCKIYSTLQAALLLGALTLSAQSDVTVRFDEPASHFTASSPLGNGRMGAMVFGNTNRERIVLNEISMWSGGIQDADSKEAGQYLHQIRQLLLEGKNIEAQKMLQQYFICAGPGSGSGNGANVKFGCYQTLGDLFIQWKDTVSAVSDYQRTLKLDSAINTLTWKKAGVTYKEEVLVSAPQQVIAIRLVADKPGSLSFSTGLYRRERASIRLVNGALEMTGTLNGGNDDPGVQYAAVLKVISKGGTRTQTNEQVTVNGADECILLVDAHTNMNWPNVEKPGPAPLPVTVKDVAKAASMAWPALLQSHVKDYSALFNRCQVTFTDNSNNEVKDLSTVARLQRLQQNEKDASLMSLYFNFGRYLLISSSRKGGMPANLQGLWAEEYQTPWNGDYHLDINVEMNYWPAEVTNLSDCHQPLFTLTKQMADYGRRTARRYYNAKGWVAHVIANPWGYTSPGEGAGWGSTANGGAWVATHLWKHYQYTNDKQFLKEAYPILKGVGEFYRDVLITEPSHHWLVTAPSNSPENTYVLPDGRTGETCMGPTMDMQICRDVLGAAVASARILQTDKAWADSLQHIVSRLAPNQISPTTGGVQEWLQDYKEADPHHRHVSPLYGLYPYDEITPWDTPEMAAAAKRTLQTRGDAGTGWSRAWKVAFWARLGDGNHAYKMLKELWAPAAAGSEIKMNSGAGTYANLFCAHPPFQIDGNFGATAGIAEMLLQSHGVHNIIRFLPALPSDEQFAAGKVKGLKAVNGFVVDFTWQHQQVQSVNVFSGTGAPCRLLLPASAVVKDRSGAVVPHQYKDGVLYFNTTKGMSYGISIKQSA
ncbi:glycosyl hydrolase family 95 catalytic domain-containing protein [Chitinophaga sp. Ak27]|uniref:glycosyl hydrolase family 95 catalytic domain-containing protein n=1 Tax=Chitinophaga sp. Ak27 TaxID=2726116 RepID=UPI00145EAD0E|nr:glycoside hydrolase N-terminal domain-containing protein [Chitinophaga sp. Ak27]NLU95288.1 glycoside hydrolase family 95 protein [Chitinophaga sp. Ak27]